jgi:threonylcarbamoyladenosine tRNA methylthiotransferase MtaB
VTVEVVSLGCRLNISESERLRGLLAGGGDLVVVNSCAVTSEAVRQTRRAIRRARRARPGARLLVTGCAAEVERDMLARMPEVDGLVANAAKLDVNSYRPISVRPEPVEGPSFSSEAGRPAQRQEQPPSAGWSSADGDIRVLQKHTRAFVQVQNGCDHACTFCVIPQGRGPSRSQDVAAVLNDVSRHVEAGAGEIVLTGVDLTSWGGDLPGTPRLGALVAAILDAFPRLSRLRLSSIDGAEVDPQLFELIAGEARVMPHVHLSLQSGDDMILKRMKRRHTRRDAVALVERLRARRPPIAIGADLIAGFPTEDEAMHANSLALVRDLRIVHGHVFPFSPRPGTPAARMPQVDPRRVRARAAELRAAVADERGRWLAGLIGAPLRVLAESDGTGHAENFAPVRLAAASPRGAVVTIVPRSLAEGMLA